MEARFNVSFKDSGSFCASFAENDALNARFGEVHRVAAGSYPQLADKPQINGVELIGNKTSHDIKVQGEMDVLSVQEIEKILYLN